MKNFSKSSFCKNKLSKKIKKSSWNNGKNWYSRDDLYLFFSMWNYAFIDGQNLYRWIQEIDNEETWKLDLKNLELIYMRNIIFKKLIILLDTVKTSIKIYILFYKNVVLLSVLKNKIKQWKLTKRGILIVI